MLQITGFGALCPAIVVTRDNSSPIDDITQICTGLAIPEHGGIEELASLHKQLAALKQTLQDSAATTESDSQRANAAIALVDEKISALTKTAYLASFDKAMENYIKQTDRLGFPPTFFTKFRHSREKYPDIASLENTIKACNSADEIKSALRAHLGSQRAQMHNHSFDTYLIDELSKYDILTANQDDRWENHLPDTNKVVFATGTFFRGCNGPSPIYVFKHGFEALTASSKAIKDYYSFPNWRQGTSTTQDPSIAMAYARASAQNTPSSREGPHKGLHTPALYVLNYRGAAGVDIAATAKAQGRSVSHAMQTYAEINIMDNVNPADIIAVKIAEKSYYKKIKNAAIDEWGDDVKFDDETKTIYNPNYVKDSELPTNRRINTQEHTLNPALRLRRASRWGAKEDKET